MGLSKIHKLEKAVIMVLNIDGWELKHTGDTYEHYDAIGLTPKGKKCVIEMKFRTKYYEEKMIEKFLHIIVKRLKRKKMCQSFEGRE